jgi:hypothetical protein
MERWYYATLDQAQEDVERAGHVEAGTVPARCRMSGAYISIQRRLARDPCGTCPVPDASRAHVCGGRPKTYTEGEPDFFSLARSQSLDAGAPGARVVSGGGEKRLARIATIAALERMTDDRDPD